MGDATIHLLLDTALAAGGEAGDGAFRFCALAHKLPGDAPLAELMAFVATQMDAVAACKTDGVGNAGWLKRVTVLDVSYHPAKIISPIVRQCTERTGPNSKTLQSLGWYPSGKLVFLPAPGEDEEGGEEKLLERFLEWQSRNLAQHEEFAYNNPDAANEGRKQHADAPAEKDGVQWTGVGAPAQGGAALKPSEIFSAVEQRSDAMDIEATSKPKPKKKPRRTEKQRAQRLDALLQKAETQSGNKKKKAVSQKVRTMLLKSRSEGNKKLRMEDRFHLEVVLLWDVADGCASGKEEGGTSYRFFSRQATAGRVASTVAPTLGSDRSAELLVSYPPSTERKAEGEIRYRRLPNTTSLHDAQKAGWVQEFDVVVVRIYDLNAAAVTDPESDDESMDEEDGNDSINATGGNEECGKQSAMEVDEDIISGQRANGGPTSMQEESQPELQRRIHALFQSLEESGNPPKKKKKPVSQQMRNMLMKSKSTGNKRIKPEDRLHLEVIVFRDDGSSDIGPSSYTSSYRFFTKQNDMGHIISTCIEDDKERAELIVRQPSSDADLKILYRKLPTELTLGDAIEKGHIDTFGRVLIRVMGNGCIAFNSGGNT
ncbi:hypothetical protein ACHAXT_005134 [Thalassiosira profunda]